jgi:hypothetical protein
MRPLFLTATITGVLAATACGSGVLNSVAPDLVVDTVPIDFGNQPVLTPATKELSLQNIGRGVLHISALAIDTQTPSGSTAFTPAVFAVTSLNPEQSTTLKIVFSAPAMGPYTAILEIKSDDVNHKSIQIPLKGNATTAAVAVAMPDCLEFGRVAEGTTAIQAVTLTSEGTAPLLINSLSIASGSCPAFGSVGSWNTNPPLSLAAAATGQPNASVDVSVAFTPTPQTVTAMDESCTGTLNIGTNDPKQQTIPICLKGSLNLAPIAVVTNPPTVVAPGSTVTLDGSKSYDPDPVPDNPISFEWQQLSGPMVTTTNPNTFSTTPSTMEPMATFSLPSAGSYSFSLTVYDSTGLQSIPARVTIIAAASDDLLIQLVWDKPTVDLDLHVFPSGTSAVPGASLYGSADCDTFQQTQAWPAGYGNCAYSGNVLDGWGPDGADITGFMMGGTFSYEADVVYTSANGSSDTATNATLRVYTYGTLVGEVTQQMTMPGTQADNFKGQLWRAAIVTWPTSAISTP